MENTQKRGLNGTAKNDNLNLFKSNAQQHKVNKK